MTKTREPALRHLGKSASARHSGAEWWDYEDIRRVLASYTHLVDEAFAAGVVPDVMQLYHPACEFSVSFEEATQVGHEAITAWYAEFFGGRGGYYRWSRHKLAEPAITVEGDSAQATSYWDADCVDRHDVVRTMAGRYDDELLKEDDHWLISKRHTWIYYHYSSGGAQEFKGYR
jgi:hypothetical protein